MKKMKQKTLIKIAILLVIIAAMVLLWTTIDVKALVDQEKIRQVVEANFLKGALLYIAVFTLVKFTFLPMTPLTAVGGYVFGDVWGALLATVAMTISSTLMFVITRVLGEEYAKRLIEDKFERLAAYNDQLGRHGLLTVIFLRIIPVAPLGVVNFGLGLTKVKLWHFVLGSVIGTLPGNILLAAIGYRATDYSSPLFIGLVCGYAVLLAGTSLLAYRLQHRQKKGWRFFK